MHETVKRQGLMDSGMGSEWMSAESCVCLVGECLSHNLMLKAIKAVLYTNY